MGLIFGVLVAFVLMSLMVADNVRDRNVSASTAGYGCMGVLALVLILVLLFVAFASAI